MRRLTIRKSGTVWRSPGHVPRSGRRYQTMDKTRDEHLAWAKQRALDYLDRSDLVNAVASMCSDLQDHKDFEPSEIAYLTASAVIHVQRNDAAGVRRWIEGFR